MGLWLYLRKPVFKILYLIINCLYLSRSDTDLSQCLRVRYCPILCESNSRSRQREISIKIFQMQTSRWFHSILPNEVLLSLAEFSLLTNLLYLIHCFSSFFILFLLRYFQLSCRWWRRRKDKELFCLEWSSWWFARTLPRSCYSLFCLRS